MYVLTGAWFKCVYAKQYICLLTIIVGCIYEDYKFCRLGGFFDTSRKFVSPKIHGNFIVTHIADGIEDYHFPNLLILFMKVLATTQSIALVSISS